MGHQGQETSTGNGLTGLPEDLCLGSNTPGEHPASINRPISFPEWSKPSASGYRISEHMINEPPPNRPFKIVMMGAGAAGIDFLHHAPTALAGLNVEIVCYDKNEDVGGTWFENRYPGCACDVPSACYQFAWRPNPLFTRYYSPAKEIWQYFRTIVEEEGMMKYIRLRTKVTNAVWDENLSKWILRLTETIDPGDTSSREWEEECDLFLNGTGFLKYVEFPHSASERS